MKGSYINSHNELIYISICMNGVMYECMYVMCMCVCMYMVICTNVCMFVCMYVLCMYMRRGCVGVCSVPCSRGVAGSNPPQAAA